MGRGRRIPAGRSFRFWCPCAPMPAMAGCPGPEQATDGGRIPTDPPWAADGKKTQNRQRRPDAAVRHTPRKDTQILPRSCPPPGGPRFQGRPSGRTIIGLSGSTITGIGPPVVATTPSSHREAMPYPDAHAPLAGAGNLSKLGWSVDPPKPSALVSSSWLARACTRGRARHGRAGVAREFAGPIGWVFAETGHAGSGKMRNWPARGLWNRLLFSSGLESDFLELVDCMGDQRKTYGEMACLWGSVKMYGEMRQACGCMGKPRYRMGRWPVYGMPLNRMGGRENVWESGAGIWGKSRGCVGTVDMEGAV